MTNELRNFTHSDVAETKLLYRWDPRNNINFHHFIDGKENLLILVRLINNVTIGGFSCYPLEKIDKDKIRSTNIGKGFLFNLSLGKKFPLKKDPKMPVLTYDEFFFLFGNSEIRIKSQEKKMYSNFGVSAAMFDSSN